MKNKNLLMLMALTLATVLVLPALAKKGSGDAAEDEEFDAENIDECKIESVNRLSTRTESLAQQWGELRGKVDPVPGQIGAAVGKEVANFDQAVEELIALELPLTVDLTGPRISVDRENLDEKQTAAADVLDELSGQLGVVPAEGQRVIERATELGGECADLIPNVATEFKGNPLQAAIEIPKATQILKGQVEFLGGLPGEVESTVGQVQTFFEALAAASEAQAAAAAEAASTSSTDDSSAE
jgi:hypothetical protein